MKYFAALLLLAVTVLADDWILQTHDDLIKYRNQCVAKYEISEEQITKYKAWDFEDIELTHNYIHCVFSRMGLFDDNEGFSTERMVRQLTKNGGDEADIRAGIKLCVDETAALEGAAYKAYKGLKCLSQKYGKQIQESIRKV